MAILIQRPALVVVTGIQAAGKSTVARLLAARFARGAHIEADALQRMVVAGAAWPDQIGPPVGEAERQLRLRLEHMCLLGRSFFDAGFGVILDDIIVGERWDQLGTALRGYPFSLVVLAPRLDAVIDRDRARAKRTMGEMWAYWLDAQLRSTMAGSGVWIDNSDQSPDETVELIVQRLSLGGDSMRA